MSLPETTDLSDDGGGRPEFITRVSPERVMPAQPGKPPEVAIIAVHGGSLLDGMSGNQGIGGQVATRACRLEQRKENSHRLARGRKKTNVRLGEPGLDNGTSFGGCHRPVADRGMREEPRKRQHDHPRYPDRFIARQR